MAVMTVGGKAVATPKDVKRQETYEHAMLLLHHVRHILPDRQTPGKFDAEAIAEMTEAEASRDAGMVRQVTRLLAGVEGDARTQAESRGTRARHLEQEAQGIEEWGWDGDLAAAKAAAGLERARYELALATTAQAGNTREALESGIEEALRARVESFRRAARDEQVARMQRLVDDVLADYRTGNLGDAAGALAPDPALEGLQASVGAYGADLFTPTEDGKYRDIHVTVSAPRQLWKGEDVEPATVNWSAMGSTDAPRARAYANLIRLGALMADVMNNAGIVEAPLVTRPTGIKSMVTAAVTAVEASGERVWLSVPHYHVDVYPVEGGGWWLTLCHYGTPILEVTKVGGRLESSIHTAWWGSRTDMAAIAKAHAALGMRRSIRNGELVTY